MSKGTPPIVAAGLAHPSEYISQREVATRYHLSKRTLERWRGTGDGPAFVRIGPRRVVYRLADCEAWAASRTFCHRAAELAAKQAAE